MPITRDIILMKVHHLLKIKLFYTMISWLKINIGFDLLYIHWELVTNSAKNKIDDCVIVVNSDDANLSHVAAKLIKSCILITRFR